LQELYQREIGEREDLIRKVTPKAAPFIRRIVVDNGFYDAIKQENVELNTDRTSMFFLPFPLFSLTPSSQLSRK
jgi:hypothetical protein